MINFTITKISEVINGRLFSKGDFTDLNINHIAIDSRTVFKGENSAFFALIGPRNNGHSYIVDLINKGISVVVVSDKTAISPQANFILVDNTTKALQQLATFNRTQFNYPVIGITGSNGKTIIKEWLYSLLSSYYKIVRNPKSYNSQVGVPISVLLMNSNYDLGIFEAGISQPEEMETLAEIINPDIGILTNIGDAHQENFHSLKQKIQEKLKLFRNSKKLIYCIDSKIVNDQIKEFCTDHSIKRISWSLVSNNSEIKFSVNKKNDHTIISAFLDDKNFTFRIPFTDASAIENSCHCFALINEILVEPKTALPNFNKLESIAMRLEIKQGINNCLLVNDYYNSDLNSLSIALSVLHQQATKQQLSKLVILSDIQQTGKQQDELYKRINELLNEWQINEIIGVGPVISEYSNQFSFKKKFYNSTIQFEKQFNRADYKSAGILIKGAREYEFERISGLLQQKAHQTELEINLNALIHNLNIFKGLLKQETKIMVMVKAFSYGSGDIEIAKLLQYQNVDYLAVAIADEGVELRNSGINTPIIVMNPERASFQNIITYRLEPNIYSRELLIDFLNVISQSGVWEYPVHLKIDTGMNRLGFKTQDQIYEAISLITANNYLKIKSVFSHLAASDDSDFDAFTHAQIKLFEKYFKMISREFPYKIDRHILNSAGIERFTEKQFEMVRLGIGLYGVSCTGLPLENIGTLKSSVSQIKNVSENETIGYGRKGEVENESKIAVVPLGYADGLDRKLSNKTGEAFVNGKRVPIAGNICMDMLMLDVSGVDVKVGDRVEFFGPNISITELAEKLQTIPYEILTGISQRVKRIYIQE